MRNVLCVCVCVRGKLSRCFFVFFAAFVPSHVLSRAENVRKIFFPTFSAVLTCEIVLRSAGRRAPSPGRGGMCAARGPFRGHGPPEPELLSGSRSLASFRRSRRLPGINLGPRPRSLGRRSANAGPPVRFRTFPQHYKHDLHNRYD